MSLKIFSKFSRSLFPAYFHFPKCHVHSMLRIHDTDLESNAGKLVKVQGWVHAVRKMKNNIFIDIADGSTPKLFQVVVPKGTKPDKLSYGSSITAEGKLALTPNGRIELRADNLVVIGTCDVMDGYPFAPRKTYPEEYVRRYLHLRPRTKTFQSVLRLRDIASASIESHLRNKGFINIHTPILTSNDCEGAGELFLVKPCSKDLLEKMQKPDVSEEEAYFNTKTFLTVSGQLHLEAIVRGLTKVYTFGPTFRAENSKSRLHLSEFRMLEAEVAFVNSIDNVMDDVELLIKNVTKDIFEKGASDMHEMQCHELQWLNKTFTRMTYDEAVNILKANSKCFQHSDISGTFTKEHELFLIEHNNNIPIFIVNWPKESKPFYMKECENDASKVAAMDLLVPIVGELVGGSIREDDYEKLQSKLPLTSNLSWYLELRKYGNVPTGGFGMGFERYLQCLFNIPNIKDTLPFPRWPHNCSL